MTDSTRTSQRLDVEPTQHLETLKGPSWHLPPWLAGTESSLLDPQNTRNLQATALSPPHRDEQCPSHTCTLQAPLRPSLSSDSCASCPLPPGPPQADQASAQGMSPVAQGPWPLHRHTGLHAQGESGEREMPYPGTIISTDGDPLELGHSIGRWRGLGSGTREHRSRGRHDRTGCRGALPILLRRHLQRQGLGPNHLETFLSKSQGQGKVGNISQELGQVIVFVMYMAGEFPLIRHWCWPYHEEVANYAFFSHTHRRLRYRTALQTPLPGITEHGPGLFGQHTEPWRKQLSWDTEDRPHCQGLTPNDQVKSPKL